MRKILKQLTIKMLQSASKNTFKTNVKNVKSQQIEIKSFSKEIENIKKKMEILNLKIIITKIKHLSLWTKYQNAEER